MFILYFFEYLFISGQLLSMQCISSDYTHLRFCNYHSVTTTVFSLLSLVPQTLRYLAEFSPNVPIMKNELGMMVSLENLITR